MRLDKYTKDAIRMLIAGGCFISKKGGLNISNFLDDDNQIDLWGLELAIRSSIKFVQHATSGSRKITQIEIECFDLYCFRRGILGNNDKIEEEKLFIQKFIEAIINDENSA